MAVNLNIKSDYTFLSSTFTPELIVKTSIINRFNVASICDFQNMFGAYQFYNLCLKNNIKPIIGVEFNLNFNDEIASINLFALNTSGYYNLVKITSFVNVENQTLTLSFLKKYNNGIVAVISSHTSHINKYFLENDIATLNDYLDELKDTFSNSYFGIYRYKNSPIDYDFLKELCSNHKIPSIAFQHVSHQSKDDTLILNLLNCIKTQTKANRDFLNDNSIIEAYFKNENDLWNTYKRDEINNLNILVNQFNLEIPRIKFELPKIVKNEEEYLLEYCKNKLIDLNINNSDYLKRMEYEYNIICKMGFANYFLIVADYVKYAKENGIVVGPARGSAGGSLISYLLNITTIDPLKYDLFFERFLNPKRVTMPDIDIDFLDIRRDEVIEYVKKKFGSSNIAQIATFSTLGAKSAIRDMARILSINNDDVDYLLKFYPSNSDISINEAYKKEEKFKKIIDMHPKYKQLVALASKIEGLKRQSGIHAAGILMHAQPLNELVPTLKLPNNTLVCQYDYKDSEKLGLLKMDFLGLKNLNIVDSCIKLINKKHNLNLTIDNIEFDNPKVYNFLSKGLCIGIFQLESDGMIKTIKKMVPTCFEDIVNLLAIYRPGPMKNIDSFIKRMHNEEQVTYLHPILEDILSSTYGIIVYQEQIMQIVQKMAGFDLAQADLFRRAITKKDSETLEKQKNSFIEGCLRNNITNDIANKVFSLIFSFAEYGFNKSHSVGYGKLAMIMAYLKCFYPTEFYTTLLEINMDSGEKKVQLFNEAKKLNIYPLLPDINNSDISYKCENNYIMFGLSQINLIKGKLATEIIQERKKGLFNSIYDVFIRLVKNDFSINSIQALIVSGCLDCFKIKREVLLSNLNSLYEYGKMFMDLPYVPNDYLNYDYIPIPLLNESNEDIDFISLEKESLGIYISTHPITLIKEKLKLKVDTLENIKNKFESTIFAKIINIEYKTSRQNNPYVSLLIEDETDKISLFGFNKIIDDIRSNIKKSDYVLLTIAYKNDRLYLNKISKVEGVNIK